MKEEAWPAEGAGLGRRWRVGIVRWVRRWRRAKPRAGAGRLVRRVDGSLHSFEPRLWAGKAPSSARSLCATRDCRQRHRRARPATPPAREGGRTLAVNLRLTPPGGRSPGFGCAGVRAVRGPQEPRRQPCCLESDHQGSARWLRKNRWTALRIQGSKRAGALRAKGDSRSARICASSVSACSDRGSTRSWVTLL